MATADAPTADAFRSDLRLATNSCRAGVVSQRANAHGTTCDIWITYCTTAHNVDSLLATVPNAVPYLQVFAQRFRYGRLAQNGHPFRARAVEDALCAVG
jgi:hypothetical protein